MRIGNLTLNFYAFGRPQSTAGLLCVDVVPDDRPRVGASCHLLVYPEFWQWGYIEDWYDGPLHSFGLGPLFILCWST